MKRLRVEPSGVLDVVINLRRHVVHPVVISVPGSVAAVVVPSWWVVAECWLVVEVT